ncbi:MAG: hypothetical protein HQL37_09055, partial [Alphaproteobacteria bacterium]|nr:hypothetical protein [Alphaproteobacteria bacterium]
LSTPPVPTRPPLKVLLVEKVVGDANLVKAAFPSSWRQWRVHHVVNAAEALDYLGVAEGRPAKSTPPDLIVVGFYPGDPDAREFIERIKEDEVLRCIPVIVLIRSGRKRDAMACYALGVAGVINKPADMGDFIEAIGGIADYWGRIVLLPENDTDGPAS